MNEYETIGSGNERGNSGIRVSAENHEPWGLHVDMVVPLPDLETAHKIRVDPQGNIISDELT